MFIFSLFELNVSYFVFWLLLVFVVGVVMFEDNKKNVKIQWYLKKFFLVLLYQKINVINKFLYNFDRDLVDK